MGRIVGQVMRQRALAALSLASLAAGCGAGQVCRDPESGRSVVLAWEPMTGTIDIGALPTYYAGRDRVEAIEVEEWGFTLRYLQDVIVFDGRRVTNVIAWELDMRQTPPTAVTYEITSVRPQKPERAALYRQLPDGRWTSEDRPMRFVCERESAVWDWLFTILGRI